MDLNRGGLIGRDRFGERDGERARRRFALNRELTLRLRRAETRRVHAFVAAEEPLAGGGVRGVDELGAGGGGVGRGGGWREGGAGCGARREKKEEGDGDRCGDHCTFRGRIVSQQYNSASRDMTVRADGERHSFDATAVIHSYRSLLPKYEDLEREALFVLNRAIGLSSIKIDNVEHRIKEQNSILRKCERTDKDVSALTDVVGLRVVALFRSDLAKLAELIRAEFEVITEDDRTTASAESFGYMSTHYECKLKAAYSGPRYDGLKDIQFEIQVRTICMHAWAAVSHYLDYKSELDIPFELRKELNALSGLFYVADSQFESAFNARIASRSSAQMKADQNSLFDERLNLDTLSAFLRKRFPDREHSFSPTVSQLLKQLHKLEIVDIQSLSKLVDENEAAALEAEAKSPPTASPEELEEGYSEERRYTDVGLVRLMMMKRRA